MNLCFFVTSCFILMVSVLPCVVCFSSCPRCPAFLSDFNLCLVFLPHPDDCSHLVPHNMRPLLLMLFSPRPSYSLAADVIRVINEKVTRPLPVQCFW